MTKPVGTTDSNSTPKFAQPTNTEKPSKMPSPNSMTKTLNTTSPFRHVFQTMDEMKREFTKFLKAIFFQLDEEKVMEIMEKILADETKTDEQIYCDLLDNINKMKKTFPILSKLKALYVLKKGMGEQTAKLRSL